MGNAVRRPPATAAAIHTPRVIVKDARTLEAADVDDEELDMIFFDCHEYDVQMALFDRLESRGIITDSTVVALHDTCTHSSRYHGHTRSATVGGCTKEQSETW